MYSTKRFVGGSRITGNNNACNKLNLWNATGYRQYGFGISNATLDYFTGSTHKWWYGTDIGAVNNGFGNIGMTLINNNLSVGANIYAGTDFSCCGTGGGYFRIECPDSWVRLKSNMNAPRDLTVGSMYAHYEIYGRFISINNTGNDYLCIQQNAGPVGQELHGIIRSL